ncbi:hypothetical protein ABZ729_16255 [Streptomyces sp. NPDC006678]|uniref:hypothetical protein n=1 Tax=Streptomyces sp. NPDC006678 TaxID=3157185 RepID=UPI0034073AB6
MVAGWKSTTARVCLTSALSGVIMLSAAGCSPEQRTLVAVYVDERGTAQALLRSCDEDGRVRGPELRGTMARAAEGATSDATQDTVPAASETDVPWIGWDTRGPHVAADFPLFAPPAQWEAETRGPQTLQPGYTYELAFGDPDDAYVYSASVTFDVDQLARVPAGEVLTGQGAMTKDAFEGLARKAC